MSGESNIPTAGADRTEASGDLPGPEASGRRTPDESTMGLPSSGEPLPASSGESDLPRLQVGESLAGRFTVLRFIARGGMGAVYEANDVMLRSRVALKVIRGRIATDAAAMERFRREVLLARRVAHRNVCKVYELYDATTAAGVPIHFLTMELLEGETLSQRIARQGRLTTTEALPLVKQMCEGLAAAHSEGVIHRDLKSSNVMLVSRSKSSDEATPSVTRVVITDFGVARAVQIGSNGTSDGPLTGGASILGTPEYMAPEQVTAGAVTEATDIYALGVVMYEMVTGKLPFTGDTPLVAAAKRLNEAPPRPEAMAPGLDARWSASILRCLARQPERRFKSALDIPSALERTSRHWLRLAGLGALGLALALAALVAVRFPPSLHNAEPGTAFPSPRPAVAVLPPLNATGNESLLWMSPVLADGIGRELAASDTKLRSLREWRQDRAKAVSASREFDELDPALRERVRLLLGADFLVAGRYALDTTSNGATVKVYLRLIDARSGKHLGAWSLEAPENELLQLVPRAGSLLRGALAVGELTEAERAELAAVQPKSLKAAQFYAEGLIRRENSDPNGAKERYEAAISLEPAFIDAQQDFAALLMTLGDRKRAVEHAELAFQAAQKASPLERLDAEVMVHDLRGDSERAQNIRRELFRRYPDDLYVVGDLALNEPPRAGLVVLETLRRAPPPLCDDLRVDIWEADIRQRLGDSARAEALLNSAQAKAESLGSKNDLLTIYEQLASVLGTKTGSPRMSLSPLMKADALATELGKPLAAAGIKSRIADIARDEGDATLASRNAEDAIGIYRRLGNRRLLHSALLQLSRWQENQGTLPQAELTLEQAMEEWHSAGEDPLWYDLHRRGLLALLMGDIPAARRALHESSTIAALKGEEGPYFLEAAILRETDRLEESSSVWQRLLDQKTNKVTDAEPRVRLARLDCDRQQPGRGLERIQLARGMRGNDAIQESFDCAVESSCLLQMGRLDEAERSAGRGRDVAAKAQRFIWRVLNAVNVARARAARGDVANSVAALRRILSEAQDGEHQFALVGFEVRLALGVVELKSLRPEGRTRLLKLEQEAKSKEFYRIARLAREALDGKPGAAPAK